MIAQISDTISTIQSFVWGPAVIVLLVGTGIYLTIRLRFVQFRYLKHAVKCVTGKYDDPNEQGDITHFQALCSALSATIGTGNIAGVALAITLGGPGAVFWMWVTAIVGMATKFASCTLAIRYRVIHADGSASGGPMYFLEQGLNLKWLGKSFALFAGVASLGAGCMVQSNSVKNGLLMVLPESWQGTGIVLPFFGQTQWVVLAIGLLLAILVGVVIIGGIRRIALVAEAVVPFMCVIYVLGALVILALNLPKIPEALGLIIKYAFTPIAAGGGFLGMVLGHTIRMGVARGIFSNESGQGSAPIAHAAAKTHEMTREGMVAMLGPFIDTIIICSMTALVIIISGAWQVHGADGEVLYGPNGRGLPLPDWHNGERYMTVVGTVGDNPVAILDSEGNPYEVLTGVDLTASAFEQQLPNWGGVLIGKWIVVIGLVFFAYSTMIAWSYYGDRSWEYLLGPRSIGPYRYIFCFFVFLGPLGGLDLIWDIADILNALMAVPNLIALLLLATVVSRATQDYVQRMKRADDL